MRMRTSILLLLSFFRVPIVSNLILDTELASCALTSFFRDIFWILRCVTSNRYFTFVFFSKVASRAAVNYNDNVNER